MDRLVSPTELAAILGVARRTIIFWARNDRIPAIRPTERTLRFDVSAVLKAMSSQAKEFGRHE